MCGRFVFFDQLETLKGELSGLFLGKGTSPRYNISPGSEVFGVAGNSKGLKAGYFQWGLVPRWAAEPKTNFKMINARAETIDQKKSFKEAFEYRRCVILANGFFEWQKTDPGKQPYFISLPGRPVFAMAAIWERWRSFDLQSEIISTSIITTSANEQMSLIHDRMPVILSPDEIQGWIRPDSLIAAKQMLNPFSGTLEIYPVSRDVNKGGDESPHLIQPVAI